MYANIAIIGAPNRIYTYALPDEFSEGFWLPGMRVVVPLANSTRCGLIINISQTADLPETIRCQPVLWPLEGEPVIRQDLLDMLQELSKRQGMEIGAVLNQALPGQLKTCNLGILVLNEQKAEKYNLKRILQLSKDEKKRLAKDLEDGSAKYCARAQDKTELEIYELNTMPPWPLRPAARKQKEILEYLFKTGPSSRKKLAKIFGPTTSAALLKLLQRDLVKPNMDGTADLGLDSLYDKPTNQYQLNQDQLDALAQLESGLWASTSETRLLFGITGSGKTAVYLELIRRCLEGGKSALLLAPEVALAHKLYLDAKAWLKDAEVILYHGYQPQSKREHIFRKLSICHRPHLIVGTRSALFLPVPGLACIIMDEEHDSSYKQEERLPYHAKELAWHRMRQNNGLLVLASATPDIKGYFAAQNGWLPMVSMRNRASGIRLPDISLVKLDASGGNCTQFSGDLLMPEVKNALQETMSRGEQAVILLNRRGYAPMIFCQSCEKTVRCPNCQISLTYHKSHRRLVCHYCGYFLEWPAPCPDCGSTSCIPLGEGTEKIAEGLEAMAGRPVLRLDRDNVRKPVQADEILAAFGKGESPFLVGTQMLSKGHHFPNVTLVVVADGDLGLNMPDYRAAERTFQLLTQAAGRSGRASKIGRAMIQTRDAAHYCWEYILHHDYAGFYETELALRKKYDYPPFSRLGLLRLSYEDGDEPSKEALFLLGKELKDHARKLGVRFLGPAPAPIAIINNRRRFQCLLKCGDWLPMRELWFFARQYKPAKRLRIMLDLDPVNMM